MIRLDAAFLADVHLGRLSPAEGNLMLQHILDTLELRVGMRMASAMEERDLDEFEEFFEREDDRGAFEWLELRFPDYRKVVTEELELLRTEIRQMAPTILELAGLEEG